MAEPVALVKLRVVRVEDDVMTSVDPVAVVQVRPRRTDPVPEA
jgi:hypothetical protein